MTFLRGRTGSTPAARLLSEAPRRTRRHGSFPACSTPDAQSDRSMAAAVVVGAGRVEVRRAPVPAPGPGQVRLKLEGCGVCASNLGPWSGPAWMEFPTAPGGLGHEGWGVVDAVGQGVTAVRAGPARGGDELPRLRRLRRSRGGRGDPAARRALRASVPRRAAGLRDEHLPPRRDRGGADGGDRGDRLPGRDPDIAVRGRRRAGGRHLAPAVLAGGRAPDGAPPARSRSTTTGPSSPRSRRSPAGACASG